MADSTQFDHDRIAHILSDRLLSVPAFQRNYAWDEGNISDFLSDLNKADKQAAGYFLGTVVFAATEGDVRQQIVDGQQRLATTAILLVAIRDLLRDYKKDEAEKKIDETFLRGYDLDTEQFVERLRLNSDDQPEYERLLARAPLEDSKSAVAQAYQICWKHVQAVAPTPADYRGLIDLANQLGDSVQVLVAVASDLPEAYVIFETLNDRGADLTKADLLKNFLFSQAGSKFDVVQRIWVQVSGRFEKADDLVKFIRYEYMSRNGHVTTRNLYKALQSDIGTGATNAQTYAQRLAESLPVYESLRDADAAMWDGLPIDMRDAVVAFRRFGFESSIPLLISAFREWRAEKAAKLYVKVVAWSLRALFAGKLGGSVSERAFSDTAKKVSDGSVKNQDAVRDSISALSVDDADFRRDFQNYGNVPLTRAKYLLGQLERAWRVRNSETIEGLPDWNGRGVTLEHLYPRAAAKDDDIAKGFVESLGNMALLERSLNRAGEDKPFVDKKAAYAGSVFALTAPLALEPDWTTSDVAARSAELAALAVLAWPA